MTISTRRLAARRASVSLEAAGWRMPTPTACGAAGRRAGGDQDIGHRLRPTRAEHPVVVEFAGVVGVADHLRAAAADGLLEPGMLAVERVADAAADDGAERAAETRAGGPSSEIGLPIAAPVAAPASASMSWRRHPGSAAGPARAVAQ